MPRFEGLWDCKEDLERDFSTKIDHEIIFAWYEYEDYSGASYVLSTKDGELYENECGHCSCNGLDGGWGPVVTSREALEKTRDAERSYSYRSAIVNFLTEYLA